MTTEMSQDQEIDRLVDGELPSESRRRLLLQLDSLPNGWKRCALAFLEAQAWRTAFGESSQAAVPSPNLVHLPRKRRVVPVLAWAAVILAAFVLGWAVRVPRVAERHAKIATDEAIPAPPVQQAPPAPRPSPILARDNPNQEPSRGYVEGLLEREGYQVERDRVLVPATTKAGQPVAVPVQRIRVRYVGNRAV